MHAEGKAYRLRALAAATSSGWSRSTRARKRPRSRWTSPALGGNVKATDVLGGTTETWSGTAKIALAPESGRLFRLARAPPKPAAK